MAYTVLFVDDEKSVHIVLEKMLADQFNIVHAYNAQEAINIISEEAINLLLCDIEMPGMTGLELLESIQKDDRKDIPFLILTSHDSEDTEREAYNLGATDFISKLDLIKKKEDFIERVQMKLVSRVEVQDLEGRLVKAKNEIINNVMKAAIKKDFTETVKVMIDSLFDRLDLGYVTFWIKDDNQWKPVYIKGLNDTTLLTAEELLKENGFNKTIASRKPYLNNNITDINIEKLKKARKKNGLPSQMGIPLFAMNEKSMLMNNMEVPADTPIFGYVFLLGNELKSSKEFDLLSKIVMQSGSILWRLLQK
jgi:CheY-like chemotaxis protein